MNRLLTKNIATMTEMREPQRVLDQANGEPVAILKNSQLVGYFVPEAATQKVSWRYATDAEFQAVFEQTRAESQPVLDYLKDK